MNPAYNMYVNINLCVCVCVYSYALLGADVNPASPTRGWLMLTFNGMADARDTNRARPYRNLVPYDAAHPVRCVNCFQPGKDIVIPFPPKTIDVPGCASLRNGSIFSPDGVPPRAANLARPPVDPSIRPPVHRFDAVADAHLAIDRVRDTLFFYAGRIQPNLQHARFLTYYDGPNSPNARTLILQVRSRAIS